MQFLRRALDEPSAERCGKCSSCLQHPLLSPDIDSDLPMRQIYLLNTLTCH